MKIKLFFLFLICIFLGIIIVKQHELITVPKDERKLIRVTDKMVKGIVTNINDGDSFVFENGTRIRLFGIDAPELGQTCFLVNDINAENNPNIVAKDQQKEVKDQQKDQQNLQPQIPVQQEVRDKEVFLKEEIVKCGEDAKNKLSKLIGNNSVTCLIKGKDAYDRLVGDCNFEVYNRRTRRKDKVNINKEMVLSGYAVSFQQITDKYVEDENKAKQENKGIWSMMFDMPSVYRNKSNN